MSESKHTPKQTKAKRQTTGGGGTDTRKDSRPSPVSVIPIGEVSLDAANVRKRTDRNLAAIRASLQQFAAGRSIVLDADNVVRAGNGTVEAARELGFDEILVVEPKAGQIVAVKRSDWSATEAAGYGIADNRSAELATWDEQALAETLRALESEGMPIDATGFTEDELAKLIEKLATDMLDDAAPDDFDTFDESIDTEHECPKCGYKWSGKAN